jgi:hypothetical protein
VSYAHALVSAPRLALAWLAPIARWLGDPRLDLTGMFLSVSRVLPNRYPLNGELDDYIADEHPFGRLLDLGVITENASCAPSAGHSPHRDGLCPRSRQGSGVPSHAPVTDGSDDDLWFGSRCDHRIPVAACQLRGR